jgi:glycosyltransferase involved in cell wall biosynthesis
MKIAIDLRSLSSGTISGVENYCLNLLDSLLKLDNKNHYTLFYNAFSRPKIGDFNFVNSSVKNTKLPNKLVNLALKTKILSLEKLAGEFDCLFMPNLNQFNVNSNAKVVLTVHDLSPVVAPEFYDVKRRLWHQFLNYKKAFGRANMLLAVSEYTKSDLIKIFGINQGKIKVIYPGLDHKIFHPGISVDELRLVRNLYGLPGQFVLFLNTIEPRKNLVNLIKAYEKLDHPASLVIAGRLGWKFNGVFRLINKSKKSAKIKYIGYIDEKHKPALIKLASVLVYPSFYEGFGFQPLEAMAMGTPVIASQLTSVPEVVGDAGLLVNPYSVVDLTAGLMQIFTNQKLKDALVGRALIKSAEFTWGNTAKATLEILNRLK